MPTKLRLTSPPAPDPALAPDPAPDRKGSHVPTGAAPPRGRRWLRVVATVASMAVLAVTGALSAGSVVLSRISTNVSSVDLAALAGDRPTKAASTTVYEPINMLLMGSDTRVDQGSGFGTVEAFGPPRSDTAILVHVSGDRKRALAVSLPRDSWVKLPECVSADGTVHKATTGKLNSAFERGGPACTVKTVESLTGIYVDHFAVIDFRGFQQVIDAIGGVEVCLPTPVDDPKSKLKLPAGVSVVNGEQALAFVRARKTLGDGSDIGRIQRQQHFLSSAIRKATSLGVLANPVTLYAMLDSAASALTVDSGLADLDQMKQLALSMQGLSPERISFTTVPHIERGDGENVLWLTAAAEPIWQSMRADSAWPPPPTPGRDGKPLKTTPSNVTVAVVNASGEEGRATALATELSGIGFAISGTTAADTTVRRTVIEYDPRFDESARTLAAAIPGARLRLVEGAGHVAHLERPAEVDAAVLELAAA